MASFTHVRVVPSTGFGADRGLATELFRPPQAACGSIKVVLARRPL